jgi:hypothetical protein
MGMANAPLTMFSRIIGSTAEDCPKRRERG